MSCLAQRWPEAACRSAAGDEDVFAAVVVDRLSVEATEESLELEPRYIEEPEPFVLGCPPQRAGGAVVERDVDSVVADRVPNRVGQRFVLVLSVQPGRELMIEREGVPCEPSAGAERRRNTFEVWRRSASAGAEATG